jgi:hypothetical protein
MTGEHAVDSRLFRVEAAVLPDERGWLAFVASEGAGFVVPDSPR